MNTEPKKRVYSPLYPSGTSISIQDVQKHRRFYNYFIQFWRNNRRFLHFPREIDSILNFLPQLCFVPCFMLSYTCCRVGELKQIKVPDILNRKDIVIKSSKSKHIRSVPPFAVYKPDLLASVDPKTMLCVVSYDHLKNSIRQAKKRAKLPPIDDILDLTHIFRHITATSMNNEGIEISVISDKLGHLNKETTLTYIH